MATTSTVTGWLEQLATSLLPTSVQHTTTRQRRALDAFQKRVRHHPFGRTDQFDVKERLDGLEEKFQILSREDLSDALHDRRVELANHDLKWLPDVLDLLLRLSEDPIGKTKKTTDVRTTATGSSVLPTAVWAEPGADHVIDPDDPIWQHPNFSDLSSDEDDLLLPGDNSSPATSTHASIPLGDPGPSLTATLFEDVVVNDHSSSQHGFLSGLTLGSWTGSQGPIAATFLVRESLYMLLGYPTTLYDSSLHQTQLRTGLAFRGLTSSTVDALVQPLLTTRQRLLASCEWLQRDSASPVIGVIQSRITGLVEAFRADINQHLQDLVQPKSTMTVTILSSVHLAIRAAAPLEWIFDYVEAVHECDSIACLEKLYDLACEHVMLQVDIDSGSTPQQVFLDALEIYLEPIQAWMSQGFDETEEQIGFLQRKDSLGKLSCLWHDWYEIAYTNHNRPPSFLTPFLSQMLAMGKTNTFIRNIRSNASTDSSEERIRTKFFASTVSELRRQATDALQPFAAGFSTTLSNDLTHGLAARTEDLKSLFNTNYILSRTLDALETLYLRRNGAAMEQIEVKLFGCIDQCLENWNDRFLVADMLEEVFVDTAWIDTRSVTVHSAYTSSRSMENRRRSVKVLGALAIEYILPWTVANLVSQHSMSAYRRVALQLMQIWRSKYVLERLAHANIQVNLIGTKPRDQTLVQAVCFTLLTFVNVVCDHFTSTVIRPLTLNMRRALSDGRTVDGMVEAHTTYMASLEHACLTNKSTKVLRDTLISLLDLCIRFSDLTSPSPNSRPRQGSDQSESHSFISAHSNKNRRRRRRHRSRHPTSGGLHPETAEVRSSDESDDDIEGGPGEGYSSFIVLDEDTTVMQEIEALYKTFKQQSAFFVAGLRGIGRGGDALEVFEVLAGRLDWKVERCARPY